MLYGYFGRYVGILVLWLLGCLEQYDSHALTNLRGVNWPFWEAFVS